MMGPIEVPSNLNSKLPISNDPHSKLVSIFESEYLI